MRAPLLTSALLASVLCAGCDDGAASSSSWRLSDSPVGLADAGIAYAVGSTVVVGDERIDAGAPVAAFVVAGDGIYFVADEDPSDDFVPQGGTHEMRFADRDGEVVDTGVHVLLQTLRASPDGRHLVALDMGSGEEDDFGTPQAELVVWDLAGGEEVVRDTSGTGDPDEDDFADLYPELEIGIDHVDDQGVVLDASGTWAYDFASGAAREVRDPDEATSALDAPDGGWSLDRAATAQTFLGPDGERVEPRLDPARLELFGWLDPTTAYGVLRTDPTVLVTCTVPSGACAEHRDTAGRAIVLPAGLSQPGLDLRGGDDD